MDFDPDALVLNAVYALCGPFSSLLEDNAASAVERPAAAPIDECELCHSSGYMDETLGGALPGVPDAPCMNGCKATEQTAPSPADERAALAKLRAEMFDWLASCTKEHIDGKIEFINRVTEGFAAIYARAAASPAASVPAGWKLVPVAPTPEMCCAMEEAIDAGWKDSIVWARGIAAAPQPPAQAAEPVAQWQYRIRTPGYDGDWHNCNPETAKRLQEHPYAEDHDVRALYAAPQSAQADAPVRTEALRKGLFEARDAMRVMSNWVKEIDPAGYSWGIHMVHRANAVLNGGADTAQADAPAEAREPHSDDVAVDSFAAAMKHKLALARAKGRGGWETCSPADLSRMLREHVEKGDPRDVANFCMMLWHHGSPIVSAPADARVAQADAREGLTGEQREVIEHAAACLELSELSAERAISDDLRALLNGANHAE
ncbi:hypothetical protein C6T61_07495 [Burkholderia multivorans]|nr:hypothetical protein C6T61_07495 [Burkholderia multivorans]